MSSSWGRAATISRKMEKVHSSCSGVQSRRTLPVGCACTGMGLRPAGTIEQQERQSSPVMTTAGCLDHRPSHLKRAVLLGAEQGQQGAGNDQRRRAQHIPLLGRVPAALLPCCCAGLRCSLLFRGCSRLHLITPHCLLPRAGLLSLPLLPALQIPYAQGSGC